MKADGNYRCKDISIKAMYFNLTCKIWPFCFNARRREAKMVPYSAHIDDLTCIVMIMPRMWQISSLYGHRAYTGSVCSGIPGRCTGCRLVNSQVHHIKLII
jgi:hypothetical protein